MQTKKIPQRKCIGCGVQKDKRELLRIVRTPEGELHIDLRGKMSGRGAYICRSTDCLKKAVKGKRIEKSLEVKVDDALLEALTEELAEDE